MKSFYNSLIYSKVICFKTLKEIEIGLKLRSEAIKNYIF